MTKKPYSVILEILEGAGVNVRLGAGAEVTLCCPFCAERGESADSRFRLGINLDTGKAQCFNCGWKSGGMDYTVAELAMAYRVSVPRQRMEAVKVKPKQRREADEPVALPSEYEFLVDDNLDRIGKEAKRYLTQRQVSTLQIVRHKIGFAAAGEMAGRVLFPVMDGDGIVRGTVGRAFRDSLKPKYLGTRGVKYLWNGHTEGSVAVVTEGVMDALRVELALMQMPNYVAVARLGSAITPIQIGQLKQYQKMIVLPDWDEAGVKGARELCSRCHGAGLDVWVTVPRVMDDSDPGSITEEEILEHIGGAVKWSEHTDRRMRAVEARRV